MSVITRLEEVILVIIWRLKDDAYGVLINKEVSKSFNKKYSMGALYFSLDQLYKKGLVSKTSGDPTPARGGRSKTYYQLTSAGKRELKSVRDHQKELWQSIPDFIYDQW